jgi:hypothetical protein
MDNHESWQLEKYGQELDAISEALTTLHPIGEVKAIGRLECAAAFTEWQSIVEQRVLRLRESLVLHRSMALGGEKESESSERMFQSAINFGGEQCQDSQ